MEWSRSVCAFLKASPGLRLFCDHRSNGYWGIQMTYETASNILCACSVQFENRNCFNGKSPNEPKLSGFSSCYSGVECSVQARTMAVHCIWWLAFTHCEKQHLYLQQRSFIYAFEWYVVLHCAFPRLWSALFITSNNKSSLKKNPVPRLV